MVDETTLGRKIDVRLRALASRLDALPMRVAAGTDRDALDAEWRDALDRFDWVHARFMNGDLSSEQCVQHRHNLDVLTRHLPIVRQLGLTDPHGDLAAWLDAHRAPPSLAEPA